LAPVQFTTWGHPETTGLPTIDHYVSGELFEPEGAQQNYAENLVLLPNIAAYYSPYIQANKNFELAALGLSSHLPILLCPGTAFKYSPQYDWVPAQIAQRVGPCQIVFFRGASIAFNQQLEQRLRRAFHALGLEPDQYLHFLTWMDGPDFHAFMAQATVFLDTIGFSGFNTAVQALECGLPVITWEGRFLRSRLASALLRGIDLKELIAPSIEDYINLAVRLVCDIDYAQSVRAQIQTQRTALFEDLGAVRALEDQIEAWVR
jgi:predicted O-linked N-acetylglucosamine transferase (SPINDLY family)